MANILGILKLIAEFLAIVALLPISIPLFMIYYFVDLVIVEPIKSHIIDKYTRSEGLTYSIENCRSRINKEIDITKKEERLFYEWLDLKLPNMRERIRYESLTSKLITRYVTPRKN